MVTNSLNTIETKALCLFVGRKSAAGRWAICLLLCFLGVPVAADNGKADALIAQFDASDGAVGPANRFFAFLDGENFTDGKIVLAKGMHADSVRQKVWYWAAEWYNDVQNYQRAQAYALKALPLYRHANADKADCLNLLGIVLAKDNRHEEAVACFRQASAIFARMGDLYNDVHSHKGLYESLWTVNPDSARIALETYHTLKDSLYHQVSASALARYNAEFGADRLQEEAEEHRHAHRRTSLLAVGGNFSPLRVPLYAKAFQAQIQEDAGVHQDGGASPAVGGCFR